MSMNGQGHERELFGGSIQASIPTHFLDVSNFREIPDNQEVFVSNQDETSIMFDILERVECPDLGAAEFHFDALGTDNEVDEEDLDVSRVFSMRPIEVPHLPYHPTGILPDANPRAISSFFLSGYQRVLKGHYRARSTSSTSTTTPRGSSDEAEYVLIFLVVMRLATQATDVVISVNYPVRDIGGITAIHAEDRETLEGYFAGEKGVREAEAVLRGVVGSFEVRDWGLFDDDDDDEEEEEEEEEDGE